MKIDVNKIVMRHMFDRDCNAMNGYKELCEAIKELQDKIDSQTLPADKISEALPNDEWIQKQLDKMYDRKTEGYCEAKVRVGYKNGAKDMRQQCIEKLSGMAVTNESKKYTEKQLIHAFKAGRISPNTSFEQWSETFITNK